MAYDEALAARLRETLGTGKRITEKPMFGGICFLLNGNMLCAVSKAHCMFRVGKEREEEALARPGAEIVSTGGRRKGGLVWVEAAALEGQGLGEWLSLAEAFVGGLPVKD